MVKKLILQISLKFVAVALGIFTLRWINGSLSENARSEVAVIIAFTTATVNCIDFGVPRLIQKFYTNIQEHRQDDSFWTSMMVLRIFTFFISIPFLVAGYYLLGIKDIWIMFGIFGCQFVILSDISYRSVLDAKGKGFLFSMTDIIGKAILLSGLFLFSKIFLGLPFLWIFIISSLLGYLISFGIDGWLTRKYIKIGKFDWRVLQENKTQISLLIFSGLIAASYSGTDILFLNFFDQSNTIVNGYDNAYKMYVIATIAPGVAIPTLASHLKKKINNSKNSSDKKNYIKKYFVGAIGFGVLCFITLRLFGDIALWIVGANIKYPTSTKFLPILGLSLIVLPLVILISNLFVFFEKEALEAKSVLLMAIFSFICYFVLVKNFGGYGASIALVLTLSFDLFIKTYLFWKHIYKKI